MKKKLQFRNTLEKGIIKSALLFFLTFSIGSIYAQEAYKGTIIDYSVTDVNGVIITVSAKEGMLPENTTLRAKLLDNSEKNVYINELRDKNHVSLEQSLAYDITLLDGNGNEVQPNGEVTVSLGNLPFQNDNNKIVVFHAETSSFDFTLIKKDLEQPSVELSGKSKSKSSQKSARRNLNQIEFKTNHFSVYLVGTTKTATYNFYINSVLSETQIVLNGETLVEPINPTAQTGKRFTGWFVQGSSTAIDFSQPITVNTTETKTVNAGFENIWYVFFTYNSEIVTTKEVVPNGTTNGNNIPISVTQPGKAFAHWSLTANGPAFNFSTQITANTTLYAVVVDQWKVLFNSQGGSSVLPNYVINGQNVSQPTAPTRVGYTFKHWSTTSAGTAFNFSTAINANITLFAVWTPKTVNYNVVYWQQNAEDNGYTYFETRVKTGLTGANAGYDLATYTGFNLNAASSNAPVVTINGDGTTIKNVYYDRNLWTFKMEYKTGSAWSTFSTTQVKYGQSTAPWYNAAVASTSPNLFGYRWLIARGSSTSYSEAPSMPNANLTVSGEYAGNTPNYINYVEQINSTVIHNQFIFYGDQVYNFTIEDGIYIKGFTVNALSTWEPLGSDRNGTIYYTRNSYTITFITNDGNTPQVSSPILYENNISGQALPGYTKNVTTYTVDGVTYTFKGWFTSPILAPGSEFDFAGKTMQAENFTLYAKWQAPTYTVLNHKLLEGLGSSANTIEIPVVYGGFINANDLVYNLPTGMQNSDFIGWYWYVDGVFVVYDFSAPVYGNLELFPVWPIMTYQVTYLLNGGTGTVPNDPNKYYVGAYASVLPATGITPPSTDKVFIGWKNSGILYYPNGDLQITGDMTLTAQWGDIAQETQITYNANGGTGSDIIINLDNNATHIVKPATTFTRIGYTLTSWNTKSDGSGTAFNPSDNIIVDNKATVPNILYAQWRVICDITATAGNNSPVCNDAVTIGLTETGIDAVSWSWSSNGSATFDDATLKSPTASGFVNGEIFTVEITAANGCKTTDTTTIIVNALPTVAITNNNGLALTCSVPSTTLTASGGVNYSWSDGTTVVGTSANLTVTTAGTFTVTVTGANGCTATASATTTLDNTVPVVAIADDNGLALTCSVPSTTLTASGGVSYSWSNGSTVVGTSANLTVTTAGTFTVTVTGANGCTATASATTTLDNTVPVAAIADNNGLALTCSVPSTTLTASGGVSYSWSDGTTVVGTSANLTVTTAGTFTVTVTGANGCTATASVTTTLDNTVPTVAIADDNGLALTCSVPSTTLTASGGVSYLWNTGATTASINVTTAGTFTVTVTGANGCTATASVTTTLDDTVPVAAIADDNGLALTCSVPSTTLTASGGVSYLWNTGATTASINVTTAGTFTVTVTGANGCTATASATTTLDNTVPVAAIADDNGLALTCSVPSTTLTASGGVSYLWNTGATTASINVTTAGTFTVTVTGANGCTATASATTTLDNTVPVAAIADDNGLALTCSVPSTTLTASGGVSYLWNTGATTASINVTTAGTFTVTVTGANGCTATASATTTLDNTVPVAAIADDNGLALTCSVPSTTLTASGGVSYLWNTGATTASINVTTAGTFTVTVTGANGCTATASVTTTLDDTVPVAAIADNNGLALTCSVPSTTLTASGGASYLWNTGATTASINVTTAGTFTVTVTGANGCTATASATTTLDDTVPVAAIADDNGLALTCSVPSTTLTASGGASYLWNTGATTASINVTTAGTFTVTVTGANGCTATASATTTLDNTVPVAVIADDNGLALTCSVPSTTLTASGGVSYSWSDGTTVVGTSANLTVTTAGTFTVTVTGANGCTATASATTTLDDTVPVAAIAEDNGLALTCSVPSTTLTASGGVSYSWSNGSTVVGTSATLLVSTAGTFTVTVTGANGCTATASATTTLDDTVPVAAIADDNGLALTCSVPSTTLTASGGVSYLWNTGATTASINVTTAGTFTVTVTGANGCTDTASVTTTLDNTVPVVAIADNNGLALTCSVPSTTLTASGGVSYSWSNGSTVVGTSANLTVTTAGTFTVTVTGANGCTDTTSVTTTLDDTVPVAAIADNNGLALTCSVPSTTLTASGGVSYLWNTGATTASINVTTAGTFTVTVTGANGCTATASVTTTLDDTVPVAAIADNNGLALTCSVPSTTLTASGGVSYLWNTGATTASINVTTAGTFTVTVTGANGCTATASATTTLDNTVPVAAIADDNGLALTCSVPSTTLTASGGVSYSWSDGTTVVGTSATLLVSTAGTFTVTVTGANGCTDTTSVTTTLDDTVPVAAIADDNGLALTCSVPSTTLTASGGVSYSWSDGSTVVGTSANLTVTTAGTFTVTVTGANGCTATASATTTLDNTVPTITAGFDAELTCTNTTFVLNGHINSENQEASFSYLWTTLNGVIDSGETTLHPTISTPGTYTLTVTNNYSGCSVSDSVIIKQDITKPEVTLVSSATELTCSTPSITLSATGTVQGTASYLWSKNNNLIDGETTAILTVTEPGEYIVIIKDSDNGCYGAQKVVITQNILQPEVNISSDTTILTCLTESITLTATATVQGTASYLWSTGATTTTINVSAAGDYSVTVTDSANGCSVSETVVVTQDITKPELTISSDTTILTCLTESITLTATAKVQGVASYLWNTGATTSTIEVTESGNYSVTVTDSNSGCSATATVTITGDATMPTVNISGNAILTCVNESVTLTATATVQGVASYLWNTGATTATIEVTAPGDYSVAVLDGNNGCSATATTTVTQNVTPPVVSISGNEPLTCSVNSITLNASGSTVQGVISYLWNTGETTASIEVDQKGDYTVVVTDSENGCSNATTVTVTENYVAADITGESIALCIEDASLDLTSLLPTGYVTGGTWSDIMDSGGLTGNMFNPSEVNLGDYEFTYTEPGDCGRIITIAVNVNDDCVVLACSTDDMKISKVVTPNDDGYNDNFEITGLEDCDFTFGVKIFNRWGKVVYESNNYLNNWNGRHDGSGMQIGSNSKLPTGTYYYIVTVSGGSGFKPMTGYIYLGTH